MENQRLKKQIAFIKEVDKLKEIKRKTKLLHVDRNENDAEHSWHLAIMAMVLMEHSNEKQIDMLTVIKMVLIHDIVEIDAGDTFLFDSKKSHDNQPEEAEAAKRIFGILPGDQAKALFKLWQEFEEGITAEARMAKALDRLAPILQNVHHNGGTWADFEISLNQVIQKTQHIAEGANALWRFAEGEILELRKKGYLKE